jgi:hypothetical protein
MSKNREQSAIDVIYELLDEVKELRKEIVNIDSNIKLLNNKISKMATVPVPTVAASLPVPTATVPAMPTATAVVPPSKPTSEAAHTVKLFGRVKNQARKPLKGVYIKVYDPKGILIKSRETDTEGYWEARVLPGQYVIELDPTGINKKFLTKNVNIEVLENMLEYEVK